VSLNNIVTLNHYWDIFRPTEISGAFTTTPGATDVYVESVPHSQWYVLSRDIFEFVFTNGFRGELRYARGNIAGIYGMFLFPDDYKHPAGCTPVHEKNGGSYESNYFTQDEWILMEAAGVVFLPASGYYFQYSHNSNPAEDYFKDMFAGGYYLVYDATGSTTLKYLYFTTSALSYNNSITDTYMYSVRLVHD